jgi:hypothetical protein
LSDSIVIWFKDCEGDYDKGGRERNASGVMRDSRWGSDFLGSLNDLPLQAVQLVERVRESDESSRPFVSLGTRFWVLKRLSSRSSRPAAERAFGRCGGGLRPHLSIGLAQTPRPLSLRRLASRPSERITELNIWWVTSIALPIPSTASTRRFLTRYYCWRDPPKPLGKSFGGGCGRGYIGAVEYMPSFVLSSIRPGVEMPVANLFRKAVCDFFYAAFTLARYVREAGPGEIPTQSFLAPGERLNHPPFGAPSVLTGA